MTALFVFLYGFLATFLAFTGYCFVLAIGDGQQAPATEEFRLPEPTPVG